MAGSDDYRKGFSEGWVAASQALLKSMSEPQRATAAASPLAMAGDKPGMMPRRRGRPPKSASLEQPPPVKRGRGRPRKNP